MKHTTVFSLTSLLSIAVVTCGANAQNSVPDPTTHSECLTSTGIPGVIFQGDFGTLTPPRGFVVISLDNTGENTSTSNGRIEIFSDTKYHQEVLVYAYPKAGPDQSTTVYFSDAMGQPISSCEISVVPFDVKKHDLTATGRGYCEFNQSNGQSYMEKGANEVFDLPEAYFDGATSNPRVLRHAPELGARKIRFVGRSEGYATFLWTGQDTGTGTLKGLCPFVISDSS